MRALATPCENSHYRASTNKSCEKKKAWLDLVSAKANHRVQKRDSLKDKLKDVDRTYKDAKTRAKEYVKRRKNEIKESLLYELFNKCFHNIYIVQSIKNLSHAYRSIDGHLHVPFLRQPLARAHGGGRLAVRRR
ncbi:hypothetical protein EVAR_31608_1 [Eumeta japonica]|uniref:Uncharacterized protein n=1 Tax=Eumeta variegata TaxID=151549 RepID=A0A4C1W1W2_EUMVA|nr:hypothetical protein EVAR_31608_1 [Eumeta japonica]